MKKYKAIFLAYFASYILILFNDGVFWDDWTIFKVNPVDVISSGKDVGFFLNWPAYLHTFLLQFSVGILIERAIIFVCFLGAGIFLYEILKKFKEIDDLDALFLTLLFLVFPHNFSRISIATIQYAISFLLFYSGFYLLVAKKLRILSLIFFFFSFTMNSLLVFYAVPILSVFYLEKESIKKFILKNIDFLVIPFVFFILKKIFFSSHGFFSDYNNPQLWLSIISPFRFIGTFYSMFVQVISKSFFVAIQSFSVLVILSVLIFKMLPKNERNSETKKNNLFIYLGLFLMFVAVFPYIAVRKMPVAEVWEDRHGILLSLGAAFVLLYLIKNFVQGKAYKIVTVVMISIFCIYNFNFYLNFARYNLKNKSIMFNLENFDIIKNNQTFLIKDKTEKYMITERSEHEYIGMLNILYGGNSRLAVLNEKDIPVFAKFKEFSFYGIQNYVLEDKPDYIIEISDNDERQELINQRYMLKNILYNLNRKNRFKENTTRLIKVNFIKYDT